MTPPGIPNHVHPYMAEEDIQTLMRFINILILSVPDLTHYFEVDSKYMILKHQNTYLIILFIWIKNLNCECYLCMKNNYATNLRNKFISDLLTKTSSLHNLQTSVQIGGENFWLVKFWVQMKKLGQPWIELPK